jgi:hypothetical protein
MNTQAEIKPAQLTYCIDRNDKRTAIMRVEGGTPDEVKALIAKVATLATYCQSVDNRKLRVRADQAAAILAKISG